MNFTGFSFSNNRSKRLHFSVLFFLWFVGLLIGIFLASTYDPSSSFSSKHSVIQESSPFLSFFFIFVPICLVLVSINSSFFFFTNPIVLIEAISRGFTGFFLFSRFGDSAWLLRILFLFAGNFAAVLLWFFLIDSFRYRSHFRLRNFYHIFLLSIMIVIINHFLISDFLITIL